MGFSDIGGGMVTWFWRVIAAFVIINVVFVIAALVRPVIGDRKATFVK